MKLTNRQELLQYVKDQIPISEDSTESFWVVVLRDNELIGHTNMARGSVNRVEIDGKALVQYAFNTGANQIVFVHNHPSGSPFGSGHDEDMTGAWVFIFETIGIELFDHVIAASGGVYRSMKTGEQIGQFDEVAFNRRMIERMVGVEVPFDFYTGRAVA